MKTSTLSKPRKTGLLKARCEPELAQFYDRRAHSLGLDTATPGKAPCPPASPSCPKSDSAQCSRPFRAVSFSALTIQRAALGWSRNKSPNHPHHTMSTTTETNTALEQARAQTSAIVELVAALVAAEATGDDNATDAARQAISESPLSLEVRSGWTTPDQPLEAEEFCLLLATGGPACRIVGQLSDDQCEFGRIEGQDWGTPWTEYRPTPTEHEALTRFCAEFYVG